MSDQNGTAVVETPAVEVTNDVLLRKAVRAFSKYPSANNWSAVLAAMTAVQNAYIAQFHIGEK